MSKRNRRTITAVNKLPWFIQMPGSVLTLTSISPSARVGYMAYMRRDVNGDGRVWCEDKDIANDLGRSLKQTRRYIDELVNAGLITRTGDGVRKVTTLTPSTKEPWAYIPWCVVVDRELTLTGVVLYGLAMLDSYEQTSGWRIYSRGSTKLARGLLPRKPGGKRDGEWAVLNHLKILRRRKVIVRRRGYETNALLSFTKPEDLYRLYGKDGIHPRIADVLEGKRVTAQGQNGNI